MQKQLLIVIELPDVLTDSELDCIVDILNEKQLLYRLLLTD